MKKNKGTNNIFTTIGKEILRLEFGTDSGKINFVSVIVLALFSVSITTKDWILKLVHLIGSFVIEFKGGVPTAVDYEPTNSLVMIGIFLVAVILCIWAVYSMDRSLKKAKGEGTGED